MHSIGLAAAWVTGCALGLIALGRHASGLDPSYGIALLVMAAILTGLALPLWGHRRARWACAWSAAVVAGCGLAWLTSPPPDAGHLSFFNSASGDSSIQARVTGFISAEPVETDRSQRLRISAESIALPGTVGPFAVSGDMYAVVERYPSFELGDRLVLTGTLSFPPTQGDFDYRAYLARQGVFSYMLFPKARLLTASLAPARMRFLSGARTSVKHALQRGLPEPAASLAVGIVTGDRSSMAPETRLAFQRSGTSHVLAISGQNITMLVGILWLLQGRARGRRRFTPLAAFVTLGLLALYTAFTGASPSVVRAAIMGGVLLFAPLVGRRYDPIAALAVSAFVMSALDPRVLADAGFQLSFAAMLGMALLSPELTAFFRRWRVPLIVAAPLAASLGAQAATLPIIALISGQVSLVSPFATLGADLLLAPLMITGLLAGFAGAVVAPLTAVLGLLVWPWAWAMVWWVEAWSALPWAAIAVPPMNPLWPALYYLAWSGALWLAHARLTHGGTRSHLVPAGGRS